MFEEKCFSRLKASRRESERTATSKRHQRKNTGKKKSSKDDYLRNGQIVDLYS